MSGLVYLITGANRGIGLGLAKHYLALPDTTVIAGVRNPSASEDLSSIKPANGSKLITVKIESTSTTDAKDAAELLKSKYGLSHIDVVIANAGISTCWATALNTPPAEFQNHLNVNATGTLILFQAVHELLSASKDPKFVTVGTPVGSASELEKFPLASTSYGSSKAALHFLTRKLHFEHPDMVIFPIAPGWVKTDMGRGAASSVGMDDAPVTIDQSVDGLTKAIDASTREKTGGVFMSFDGASYGW